MKFSYTYLKQLVPGLPAKTRVAAALSAHAFEVEHVDGDVLDIKLYANRYNDAASYQGMARELAAIFSLRTAPLPRYTNATRTTKKQAGLPLRTITTTVDRAVTAQCLRHTAHLIDVRGVYAKTPTPIVRTLRASGVSSVSPIVDLLNYAMLETGQPMHAFDAERIAPTARGTGAQLIVRGARSGERIEVLNGKTYELPMGTLVIADAERALDIAGIIGGTHAAVRPHTKLIALEVATFDGPTIMATARGLRIGTDAGQRFSHGLSPALVDQGIQRALQLLIDAGARVCGRDEYYPQPVTETQLTFDAAHYERLMGAPVALTFAQRVLTTAGFRVTRSTKTSSAQLSVRVPAWRVDVTQPEDLIEEVARMVGYDAIPAQPPLVYLAPSTDDDILTLNDRIRTFLVAARQTEVYLSTFISAADWEPHAAAPTILGTGLPLAELANPVSAERQFVRPSLVPMLVQAVQQNGKHTSTVGLFEIGSVAAIRGTKLQQRHALAIARGAKRDHTVLTDVRGMVEALLTSLGSTAEIEPADDLLWVMSEGARLGTIRLVSLPKQWYVGVAELDLDALLTSTRTQHRYEPLPKYPAVVRDVALFVPRGVRIGDVANALGAPALVTDVELIDEYTDATLFEGMQSMTFRLTFQSRERTLEDAEVSLALAGTLATLRDQYDVRERS